ncbi:MAG: hypothetical protein ACLQFT_04050 [Steroidobacteraceae bacterium]|jgi:hypothetical protein
MQADEVPEDVRAFLYDHIESYEHLEILLLLQRERSETWTAERLSSRLNMSPSLTAAALSLGEHRDVHRAKACFSACGRSAHRRARGSTVVA